MSLRRSGSRSLTHCYVSLDSQKRLKRHSDYLYPHFVETTDQWAAEVEQLVRAVEGKDMVVVVPREAPYEPDASVDRGLERTDAQP